MYMNIGFYGHANTMIFTLTADGKFKKLGLAGGIKQIAPTVKSSYEKKRTDMITAGADPDSNEYRKEYYGIGLRVNSEKKWYYEINQKLGYEEGETLEDIYCELPESSPANFLFVWDEGYGRLSLPDANSIFWSSNKALPDRDQFEKIADNCFLFLDGNVLRNAGAMISRQISWERTASELISEISGNSSISYLLKARYLLISFETDGGVFILPKGNNGQLEASLLLTHGDTEGAFNNKYPDHVADAFGFLYMVTTFYGYLASRDAVADSGDIPKWSIRDLNVDYLLDSITGRFTKSDGQTLYDYDSAKTDAAKWGTALRAILESGETMASHMIRKGLGFFDEREDHVPDYVTVNEKGWAAFSIPIESKCGALKVLEDWTVINSVGNRQIYDVAFEYIQKGASAIEGLPQFKLGALTTVDRWEIESFSNIRNLILDYANADSIRPLSIAVFGSPGSGKSFGVTQIAMNILPGKIEKLEFNVSQFVSPIDLGAAFQKVRDVILEGKLPLVFFDEFDSDKDGAALGWVKSFLMPMQDGRFRDESGEHPLGKCILVFAGGTAVDFESFAAPMDDSAIRIKESGLRLSIKRGTSKYKRIDDDPAINQLKKEKDVQLQSFKNIKGPDFVSRLRGTINVMGPNPKDPSDQNHILRRAIMLRSMCERDRRLATKDGSTPVSSGIIRAMLMVPEFKHGARSMEAILDMSRIKDGEWKPDSLPFHSQLALHVDADAFLNLVAVS